MEKMQTASEEESDDEGKFRSKRGDDSDEEDSRRRGRKLLSDKATKGKEGRVPMCDEYVFNCNRWLAEDEDDGQISRSLKPATITTFYQLNN